MSVSGRCDDLRELTSELALGIADGEQRALALEHVAMCADCRRELEHLSILADELLVLAPEQEPPLGFELRALQTLQPRTERRLLWRARVVPVIAAALLAAAVATGALLYAFRDERRLATHYRATLAQAHGKSFTAVRLRAAGGVPAGTVFIYRGTPSWLLVTVAGAYRSSVEGAQLVLTDGRTVLLAAFRLTGGSWGGAIPVDAATVAGLHLLGRDGRSVLAAYLPRRW